MNLEKVITEGLGDLGIVDGHDCGSGEMNLFIDTDEPSSAFARALSLIKGRECLNHMAAGYRSFDDDEYIAIFTEGNKSFCVL